MITFTAINSAPLSSTRTRYHLRCLASELGGSGDRDRLRQITASRLSPNDLLYRTHHEHPTQRTEHSYKCGNRKRQEETPCLVHDEANASGVYSCCCEVRGAFSSLAFNSPS